MHAATYQVNTQRTKISGRHYSNGTKYGIWPPEDGLLTETYRGLLMFTNIVFNILVFLKVNPLNTELKPICHVLALLESHHILHVSGLRVKVHVF
jgi:hypothetical protein